MPNSQKGFATFTIVLVITLVLLIGGSLIYFSLIRINNSPIQTSSDSSEVPLEASSAAVQSQVTNAELVQLKKEILSEVDKKIATFSSTRTTTPTQQSTQPKEEYIYFGITASTKATDWETVPSSQIKFNTSSYPGAKAFYFQAILQSDATDRIVHARLYDSTNSTPLWGSEINYTGLTPTFKESGTMTIIAGPVDLYIQLKGLIGNQATIYNPRIKIVY